LSIVGNKNYPALPNFVSQNFGGPAMGVFGGIKKRAVHALWLS